MQTSYGVVWREGAEPLARGKLELLAHTLRLSGMAGASQITREIAYADLSTVRVGRDSADRLHGAASLVLERAEEQTIALTVVSQPGAVGELAE
ncbi:MAG TPA: hypothetical protein VF024_06840, partial [Solirubrobacteraceae bacterium]